jgi:hypothetical protein
MTTTGQSMISTERKLLEEVLLMLETQLFVHQLATDADVTDEDPHRPLMLPRSALPCSLEPQEILGLLLFCNLLRRHKPIPISPFSLLLCKPFPSFESRGHEIYLLSPLKAAKQRQLRPDSTGQCPEL